MLDKRCGEPKQWQPVTPVETATDAQYSIRAMMTLLGTLSSTVVVNIAVMIKSMYTVLESALFMIPERYRAFRTPSAGSWIVLRTGAIEQNLQPVGQSLNCPSAGHKTTSGAHASIPETPSLFAHPESGS